MLTGSVVLLVGHLLSTGAVQTAEVGAPPPATAPVEGAAPAAAAPESDAPTVPAPAVAAASPAPATRTVTAAPVKKPGMPWIGAKLDLGVPDGAGIAVVIRPWYFVRFEGGLLYNVLAPGIRAGVTLAPINFPIAPTLSVEAGHYFPVNANTVIQRITSQASFNTAFLNSVNYDFASAHLGLELGSPRRFVFFMQAGMTELWLHDASFGDGLKSVDKSLSSGPLNVRVQTVTAKLGFTLFFGS